MRTSSPTDTNLPSTFISITLWEMEIVFFSKSMDGPESQPHCCPEQNKRHACREVGICLSDSGSGVVERNSVIQHGVQHPVAQLNLGRTLRHAAGGEKFRKNPINHIMGILPVMWQEQINPFDPSSTKTKVAIVFLIEDDQATAAPVEPANASTRGHDKGGAKYIVFMLPC